MRTVCLLLLCSVFGWAQLGTATISGTVADSSGAVIGGAEITASNEATGFSRSTTSNATGQFSLPALNPGTYDVSVKAQGFKTYQSKGLILQVDQNAKLDVALDIGQLTETVEVQSQAMLVDSQTSSLGAVVDTQKILALP